MEEFKRYLKKLSLSYSFNQYTISSIQRDSSDTLVSMRNRFDSCTALEFLIFSLNLSFIS